MTTLALATQDQTPPSPAASVYEFFSGTVAELPDGRIVVARRVLGKPAENRSFVITPDTKVEGKLRVQVRVTVGFKATDEGDIAMRIIVRPAKKKS
ncbi:MAG: hypothetical protein HYZ57_12195 [Acidobacteria bacterium]|nr:hypothetical protein [Acidobacteriota bacterium]MBI3280591.1 hypothetical protein [Acidobacteriota bacterium]